MQARTKKQARSELIQISKTAADDSAAGAYSQSTKVDDGLGDAAEVNERTRKRSKTSSSPESTPLRN
jgi:hypothetical protein